MKSEDYVSLHLSQINPTTTSNTAVSQSKVGVGFHDACAFTDFFLFPPQNAERYSNWYRSVDRG